MVKLGIINADDMFLGIFFAKNGVKHVVSKFLQARLGDKELMDNLKGWGIPYSERGHLSFGRVIFPNITELVLNSDGLHYGIGSTIRSRHVFENRRVDVRHIFNKDEINKYGITAKLERSDLQPETKELSLEVRINYDERHRRANLMYPLEKEEEFKERLSWFLKVVEKGVEGVFRLVGVEPPDITLYFVGEYLQVSDIVYTSGKDIRQINDQPFLPVNLYKK